MDLTRLRTAGMWRFIKTVKHSLRPARVPSINALSSSVATDLIAIRLCSCSRGATKARVLLAQTRALPPRAQLGKDIDTTVKRRVAAPDASISADPATR